MRDVCISHQSTSFPGRFPCQGKGPGNEVAHQSDWVYYKQPIKFLVFVAGKCNKIFLFVSFKWQRALIFHAQWLHLIPHDESVTLAHTVIINKQEYSGTSRKKNLYLSFLNVYSGILRRGYTRRLFSRRLRRLERVFRCTRARNLHAPLLRCTRQRNESKSEREE